MSTAAVESKSSKPTEPQYEPQTRLAVVYFSDPVMFGAEMQSAALHSGSGPQPGNVVDSIAPAVMLADGTIRIVADGGTGLCIRRKKHDLHNGRRVIAQVFVPWTNIRCADYRGEDAKTS